MSIKGSTNRRFRETVTGPTIVISLLMVVIAVRMEAKRPAEIHIAAKTLNQVTLNVTDVQRSLKFYQDLFGMRNYAEAGANPRLEIGRGPYTLGLRRRANGEPNLDHLTVGVDNFNVDTIMRVLEAHGVKRSATASEEPLTAWLTKRGDTAEVWVNDPNGIRLQLQDLTYCGGSGPVGNQCPSQSRESMIQPSRAPLRLQTINHHLINVADPARSIKFWREVFGLKGGDGPPGTRGNPLFIGPGPQWIGFTRNMSKKPATSTKPSIDHPCFGMENFEADGVIARLVAFGFKKSEIKPQETFPFRYDREDYRPMVTFPMPRPAARDGSSKVIATELFLTDPDNITIQVNDVNYCSGFGPQGADCP